MQVKKFEARTMKEALEMVKTQLGPDAIILSARDNNRSFGLVGEGSVEITAAVSEDTLQRKRFAESRLRGQDLDQFQKSPARVQKQLIDKMVTKYVEKTQPKPITSRRYIDIDDGGGNAAMDLEAMQPAAKVSIRGKGRKTETYEPAVSEAPKPAPRAQSAATSQRGQPAVALPRDQSAVSLPRDGDITALKSEIATLREIIAQFREVPQTMVGTHPGSDYGIPYDLSFMFEKLTSTGIDEAIAAEILVKAQENIPALKLKHKNLVDGWVARHILETTQVTGEANGKIQVFLGPAGSGKTTALVKMASHLVVNEHRKVALLTTDTFKVGAADQMRMYAQILNVPFAIIRSSDDWSNIMRYLGNIDVVLVDMPGFSLKNADEIDGLRRLMPPPILNPRVHFTVSATSKDADVTEAARRYSVLGFDDAIFTGLDESTQHGSLYNFVRRFDVPLHGFGIGPRVPDDYEPATRERVLDLLFRITRKQQTAVNEL